MSFRITPEAGRHMLRSSSDAGTIHVALPQCSQSEYIPESISDETGSEESGLNDKSNQDADDYDGKSPPKKKARLRPVQDVPRKVPCDKCVDKMIENGPVSPCCNQASARATICYNCSHARRKCGELKDHVIGPGQRLQEAAILSWNGETVNNWDELVAQFRQASERGAAPRTAAPQAGPVPLSFTQATDRAGPQRENPRRGGLPQKATGTSSAQFAPMAPQLANRDNQAQLLQEAQAHNHRLEQLITQSNERTSQLAAVVQLLQQSLQAQESGFTAISSGITRTNEGIDMLIAVTRQLGSVTNKQTTELRQMHDEMRRVNGADNADLPSFDP